MKFSITIGHLTLDAKLNDTQTAKKIAAILPFNARFNTWGDEIYFPIPVKSALDESAREEVKIGDLGYWPSGQAFCIFFGPTPMSTQGSIRPASAVNIIGKVTGDAKQLKEFMHIGELTLDLV